MTLGNGTSWASALLATDPRARSTSSVFMDPEVSITRPKVRLPVGLSAETYRGFEISRVALAA